MVGMSRPPGAIPPPHPAGGVASGVGPSQGSGPPPVYPSNQQAAMMKQMMVMEEKRMQIQMMEQQKIQRQHLLVEQVTEGLCSRPPLVCVQHLTLSCSRLKSGCMFNYSHPALSSPFPFHLCNVCVCVWLTSLLL